MRVLYVSDWSPASPTNGGRRRCSELVRGLIDAGHEVTVLTPDGSPGQPSGAAYALHVLSPSVEPDPGRRFTAAISRLPRHIALHASTTTTREVISHVERVSPDLVVAYELMSAVYVSRAVGTTLPTVYDGFEPFAYQPLNNGVRARLRWAKLLGLFRRLLSTFDAYVCSSPAELGWTSQTLRPKALGFVVRNGAPAITPAGAYEPRRVLYSGSLLYDANRDAVEYFLADGWPQLRAAVPGVQLVITGEAGDKDGNPWQMRDDVVVAGLVDDYPEIVRTSAVLAVPLRRGGGTRVKVLEAFAWGCPVVASTVGVAGLGVEAGVHALVADDPDEFAGLLIKVLTDPDLRGRLTIAAQQFARENSWNRSQATFLEVLDRASRAHTSAARG